MLHFALPHGSSKSAMMAHSSTGEIKNNASNGNKKSNGTVENGIRAGRNGKRSNTAMSISHGTVAALSFLLLLVITIFNSAGGARVTVDANATKVQEISAFHGQNDTMKLEIIGTAHSMSNNTKEICHIQGTLPHNGNAKHECGWGVGNIC